MKTKINLYLLLIFLSTNYSYSQIKGQIEPKRDSVYVFHSARPLLTIDKTEGMLKDAWGFDLLLSNNGFGMGVFFNRNISEDINVFANLGISGARNTDEFEDYDTTQKTYSIPNKINRLFMIPLTIGAQMYILNDKITENFKPYISTGLGPTVIIRTPYNNNGKTVEFFKSFGSPKFLGRFGAFIGIGANVGTANNSLMGLNLRYYYIPFGGQGIESVKGKPITDFGGIFLTLSIGSKF